MTTAKLDTALKGGKSLADVAKDQKVSVGSLVKVMVAVAQDKPTAAVKNGKITPPRIAGPVRNVCQRSGLDTPRGIIQTSRGIP